MIEQRYVAEFNNCNCCGKYNMKPNFSILKENQITNNNIYEYTIHYGNGGMQIRLCDTCAREMITKLYKQVDKE